MAELTLRPYQERMVAYLRANPKAYLALTMGLGKTAISLRALTPEHLPALVIAPKMVTENTWTEEVPKWRDDLSLAIAAGTPSKRKKALESGADLVAISRDNLADAIPYRKRFKTIIVDEAQSFKSTKANRTKSLKVLSTDIEYMWMLSGTPTPQGLLDLWSQIFMLDRGARLEKSVTRYRTKYFYPDVILPSGVVAKYALRDGAENTVHAKVSDIMVSMDTVGKIDLPEMLLHQVPVKMPVKSEKLYKAMKQDLVLQLPSDGEDLLASTAAVAMGKLSQITSGFLYTSESGDYEKLNTAKLDAVAETVESCDTPVLIFYRFKAERAMLLNKFKGAVDVKSEGAVQKWNAGQIPVLLAHPASASMGLNLQRGGRHVIWTSLPWSPADFDQSNKRLHRSGQTDTVVVHVISVKGSVDESIYKALESKASVQQALLDHVRDEE